MGEEDGDGGTGGTVTLLDLYEPDELEDEREALHRYASAEDASRPLPVRVMTAAEAARLLTAHGDMTVRRAFRDHATREQRRLVREKAARFDATRVVVVSGRTLVDGNHHVMAAVRAGRPVRYVDLDEGTRTGDA